MQHMVSTKLDNTIVKYFNYFFNRKLEVIVKNIIKQFI